MVFLFFFSSGSKSVVGVPSSTVPSLSIEPEAKSIASTSEVLPAPPCAITATFRILSSSKFAIHSPSILKIGYIHQEKSTENNNRSLPLINCPLFFHYFLNYRRCCNFSVL